MIAAMQIRMARAGLQWTAQQLADRAQVGVSSINRIENGEAARRATLAAIQRTFEEWGVRFVEVDGRFGVILPEGPDHPTREEETIGASLDRAMVPANKKMRADLLKITTSVAKAGLHNSGGELYRLVKALENGYGGMCEAAATQLREIKGENALHYSLVLDKAMCSALQTIFNVFDQQIARRFSGPMEKNTRFPMQLKLEEIKSGVLEDLALGIIGGKNVKKPASGDIFNIHGKDINVVNRSEAVSQASSGIASVECGLDLNDVRQLVQELRESASTLEADNRETLEDAVVNVEREIKQPEPDQGRLRRLARQALRVARDLGIGVASNAVAAQILG